MRNRPYQVLKCSTIFHGDQKTGLRVRVSGHYDSSIPVWRKILGPAPGGRTSSRGCRRHPPGCMFAHASIFNGPRSFSMFGAPEPEPEISSLEWFCVALVFSAIIVAACVSTWWYLKTTWPKRFEGAVRHSFNKVDVDKSGEIEEEELYTCVLWLYLTCNEWGLKCIAPEKYTVIEIMKSIDVDKSGTLNWEVS